MSWYFYYLLVGVYVALCFFGQSIRYKIKHKDYVRVNPLLSWNILWQFPLAALIWWILVLGGSYETMAHTHLKQKLED